MTYKQKMFNLSFFSILMFGISLSLMFALMRARDRLDEARTSLKVVQKELNYKTEALDKCSRELQDN
jgi:hypothetical protein